MSTPKSNNSNNATSHCFSTILHRLVCTGNLPTHPYPLPREPETPRADVKIKIVGGNGNPVATKPLHHLKNNHEQHAKKKSPVFSIGSYSVKNEHYNLLKDDDPVLHYTKASRGDQDQLFQVEDEAKPGIVARLMGLDSLPPDITDDWAIPRLSTKKHESVLNLRSKSLNSLHFWPEFDPKKQLHQKLQQPITHLRRVKSSCMSFHEVPASAVAECATATPPPVIKHNIVFVHDQSDKKVSGMKTKASTDRFKVNEIKMDDNNRLVPEKQIKQVGQKSVDSYKVGKDCKRQGSCSSSSRREESKRGFGKYSSSKVKNKYKPNGEVYVNASAHRHRKENDQECSNDSVISTCTSPAAVLKKKTLVKKMSDCTNMNSLQYYSKGAELHPPAECGMSGNGTPRRKRNLRTSQSKDGASNYNHEQIHHRNSSGNEIPAESPVPSVLDHSECSASINSPSNKEEKKEPRKQRITNSRWRRNSSQQGRIITSVSDKEQSQLTEMQTQTLSMETNSYDHPQKPADHNCVMVSIEEVYSNKLTKTVGRKEYSSLEDIMDQVSIIAQEHIRDTMWVEKKEVQTDQVQELSVCLSEDVIEVLLHQLIDELFMLS